MQLEFDGWTFSFLGGEYSDKVGSDIQLLNFQLISFKVMERIGCQRSRVQVKNWILITLIIWWLYQVNMYKCGVKLFTFVIFHGCDDLGNNRDAGAIIK